MAFVDDNHQHLVTQILTTDTRTPFVSYGGATGPTGPTGAVGATGVKGATGTGATGVAAYVGVTGTAAAIIVSLVNAGLMAPS